MKWTKLEYFSSLIGPKPELVQNSGYDSDMSDHDFKAALRGAGLRVTAPRLAVLSVISESKHVDAETIIAEVRHQLGKVSQQTVYDTLHALTDVDILRCMTPDGGASLYEIEHHDNHHHLLCHSCGRLVDVACAAGETPCIHPPEEGKLTIDFAEVIYHGMCAECTAAAHSAA